MRIFVSNHLEILAEALKEELFQGGMHHPFAKKWVVVPNERVKHDLFLRWAHDPDLQVAAGVKMITWPEAMHRLFPNLPAKTELSLKIEAALGRDLPDAEPLFLYLMQGGSARKTILCEKMSALFLQYLTQPEEKISDWLKQPGWQQSLWRAVFENEMSLKMLEGSVYLFHPSQLSLYQLAAFKKMNASCFLFSPCAMYWGDFRTYREQRFLLKRAGKAQEELAHYFENEHLLLANWGLKGRELLCLFEDEEWIDRHQEPSGDSVLKTLQREMLTLTVEPKKADDSIQIHSASSKLREVEVVWDIIQRLPFEPREILVLAPDMQSYAPIVELVWRQRGGAFDFAIFGLEARSKSPLMQGLEHLLDLPRYRFSRESVEKLLFCPPFLKRFGFDLEEARRLSLWMNRVHVRYDLKHHAGSWEAGLKRLIEALVLTSKEDRLSIEFSEADLLSRWILVVQLFEKELTKLETSHSLKEWSKMLRSIVETFFELDLDDDLIREFEKLQQMQVEGVFPFATIERILKNIFQQNTGAVQASHLQAVRFISLEKGALIPAKAVILMGMEEGSFPRHDLPCSLQQLHVPGRVEEDKYLFLEALYSAREMFFMTYTRICAGDGKSQNASSLVEELRRYCTGLPITDHPALSCEPVAKPQVRTESTLVAMDLNSQLIDIRMLRKLARHPLQFFFEERLGINFEWKERDTEFVLSPLEMARVRKESLKKPLDEVLKEMQEAGKLPVGLFGKTAVQKIQSDIATYHDSLKKLQIKQDEIYSVELKATCTQPTNLGKNLWIFPALRLNNEIVIQGRIDDLCPQGLLCHGDDSLADLLKIWPLYLIAKNLPLAHPMQLLLSKKGKISEINIECPREALIRYIGYAEKALTMPSPLHPKWARALFKEGKIPESTEEDEILEWAQARNLLPPAELWLQEWDSYLREAIRELL